MIRRLAPLLVAGLALGACGSGGSDGAAVGDSASRPATEPSSTDVDPGGDSSSVVPGDATTVAPTAPASSTPPASGAPPGSVDGGSAVAPTEAPSALQFAAPLVGGGDIELTTLAGRPVLLWFWAPW